MVTSPMGTIAPGLLRRYIGRRFASLRRAAGLSQADAARLAQHARTTLIRIEEGHAGVRFRARDVARMLDVYAASTAERDLLLALTAETRHRADRGWWHDFTADAVPPWFGLYVLLEDSAETIQQYHPELVPGLLQTEDYARLVFAASPVPMTAEDTDKRVRVRMNRQAILSRPCAPSLDVILGEAAIRRPLNDKSSAQAQLARLLQAGELPGVSVRVLPLSAGLHAGAVANPFSLIQFPADFTGDPVEPPLAYVETLTAAMYLNKPAETTLYRQVWRDLEKGALSPARSHLLITQIMEGLGDA